MAEIVNLRRARKAKTRSEKDSQAAANRAKHGVAKSLRDLAEARDDLAKRAADAHRLDDKT
jgi:hypothetical protein